MTRTLVWSNKAITNLDEIGEYIARDKPQAARRWLKVLASTAEQAAALPFAGRRVPEFDRDELREMIKRGYRIVYLVSDEQIEILTVSEGHRQLPQDLLNG